AGRGFLFGGSTGTVVSGAVDWLDRRGARDLTAVAVAPDLGERYLDTVYQDNWVRDLYGRGPLDAARPVAAGRAPAAPGAPTA
ncbi:2,3-diaminopropionate biosynthesis protein SbnA, partial [Streptomyces sp. SID11233]|nr:2,3-diaminopropionate biosynthesis protein SbnA [Streptomyces sp. SID11233]